MKYDIGLSFSPGAIDISVQCELAKASLQIKPACCADGAPGLSFAELARQAAPLGAAFVQAARRRHPAIACAKGCPACCRQLVCVSAPETAMIADRLSAMEGRRRAAIEQRMDALRRRLRQTLLWESLAELRDDARDEAGHYALARAYYDLAADCPFLSDGACALYPQWPFACAEYLAASDPARCANPFDPGLRAVHAGPGLAETLARLWACRWREPLRWIALPLAVDWARRNETQLRAPLPAESLIRHFCLQLEITLGSMQGGAGMQAKAKSGEIENEA
ncbi:MAG: hypothetical protein BWZ10_00072 [candidate division BRC1 bacterium ADurb.BinA364]|nr:MAG: hypothetical protein BWZ10_00072 [candidate division BRC1 bacterium ADurb.BinA364]